jgi:glutamyl/glutaminyl-tRNA synthetase
MSRVRFAPSPTVYLHIGSARTFIFNWMYEWKNQGTMILRIDDTDLERNTEAPLQSNYDGLRWSVLGWDEEHRQSERLELHRRLAWEIFEKGLAYRDFTPAMTEPEDADELAEEQKRSGPRLLDPGMPELSREESDRRAAAGEPFVLHFRVPRDLVREVRFDDVVFGAQSRLTADIEDFALLGGNGLPTYHMASCADDADLRISPIIRGQNHVFNTYKHLLIFEVLGGALPASRTCRGSWRPTARNCRSENTARR